MSEDANSPTVLDLRGLKCPLPALRTRKALKQAAPGKRLVVECTDPLATIDIPNLLRETGDTLEAADQCGRATRVPYPTAGLTRRAS